jgi:hypothetical protein
LPKRVFNERVSESDKKLRNLVGVALGLQRFTIQTVAKPEDQRNKNKRKKYKKYATINTGCDLKIQYSQSEMGPILIYHLR